MPAEHADAVFAVGTLVVESPIHGTIFLPLRAGCTSIGSALSADLVLGDPTIAGVHFRLHAGRVLTLEAVDAPVAFGDTDAQTPGGARALLCTTEFRAGGVLMRVEVTPRTVPAPNPASNPVWHRSAVALAVLTIAGSAAFAFAGRAPSPAGAAASAIPAPGLELSAPPTLAALQAKLEERGLGLVRVEVLQDGSYRAIGTVSPGEGPAWRDVTRWFDEAAGGRTVLVDQVAAVSVAPPLAIQSAWVGTRPYVIDGAGQKLFVGAVLANGWTIEGIEAGRVTVRRQAQRLAVRF